MAKIEAEVPTDLLASLLMEQAGVATPNRKTASLPPKVYAVMALTSLSTFGTLVAGYQHFFPHQLFA